eukprot:Pgem_evm1s2401
MAGISCTMSAIESLKIRGYDIVAVVFVDHKDQDECAGSNYEAVSEIFKNVYKDPYFNYNSIFQISNLPPPIADGNGSPKGIDNALLEWFSSPSNQKVFDNVLEHIMKFHAISTKSNNSLVKRGT